MRILLVPIVAVLAAGCEEGEASAAETRGPLPEGAEAWSLAGEALYPPSTAPEVLQRREDQLAQALADFEADPSLENAIWVGRRQAYLYRYRDAIATYTTALVQHGEAPELYRHRGHRYISVRQLGDAVADLERAVELIARSEDAVEPDGQPNARNIPTSTLHFNIWYHLGLAYYLQGEFGQALRCYRACMDVSGNPDALVATSHWLYMTLRRLEQEAAAEAVLEPIRADLDVIENDAYHQLLLVYRRERQPDSLLAGEGDGVQSATTAYGVGNWFLYNGERDRAREIFLGIVRGEQWPAFGHIAAEAELQRR